MRHWGLKSWRHVAVPLAAASLVTAIGISWGTSLTSHAAASDGDPTVTSQSAIFVLMPSDDDNFQPGNACTATSLGQNRCTAAIFSVDKQPGDVSYSDTPCQAQTNDQLGLAGISLEDASGLEDCTAAAFLPSAGGQTAIHDFPGASCFPGPCLLVMNLQQHDGHFNAPGLCSASQYLTAPCTVAVVDTEGQSGGDTIDFSSSSCPESSNLSLPPIGSIEQSCTNLPFKPADMALELPDNATGEPDVNPQHGPAVEDQAETLVLAPDGQFTFDPPNACGTVGLKPVNRCTVAILDVPEDGGDISYSDNKCNLDLSGPEDACTATPFASNSKGNTAIHDWPQGTVCTAPLPASQPNMDEVGCKIYVVLTRDAGNFNSGGLCTSFTNISSPCAVAVVDTSSESEGDQVDLSGDKCPSDGEDGDPGIVITDSCTSPAFLQIPGVSIELPQDGIIGG